MTAQINPQARNPLWAWILGGLALLLIVVTLAGVQLPIISGERAAFYVLAIIGFIMCTMYGMQWNTNPLNIIGMILGVLALLLVLAVLFNVQLPLITSDRDAFIAMSVIVVVKAAIGWLRDRMMGAMA
ncbi:MAG: hypothetical protein HXY40_00465 [Chloroflexi bacterium]|nr:hypothetical protein [Chloroflexota bacterium]